MTVHVIPRHLLHDLGIVARAIDAVDDENTSILSYNIKKQKKQV